MAEKERRLTGDTAEYMLAWVLYHRHSIVANRFNIEGLDIIAFDHGEKVFRGKSPFFIQLKTRGGRNPIGVADTTINGVKRAMGKLKLDEASIYLVIGLFNDDIRSIKFYPVPLREIETFRVRRNGEKGEVRFSGKLFREKGYEPL
jgi:hypothetical protein